MRNSILLLTFTLFTSLLLAQPGNTIEMITDCVSGNLTLSYVSASGSPERNVYEGVDDSFVRTRVIWSATNNRWEIWSAADADEIVYDIFLYSNNYASAPNPPDNNTGTWTNEADCGNPLMTFSGNGTQSSLALAVELLSFTGKNNDSGNILTWSTASEYDNQGFDVERSADGRLFQKIGYQAGNGTIETAVKYTFSDRNPLAELNYYRLKQTDYDGRFQYSPVVLVKRDDVKGAVQLYPNPGTGVFSIYGLAEDEMGSVKVLNAVGQEVSVQLMNGQIDLSTQPAGTYYFFSGKDVVHLVKL